MMMVMKTPYWAKGNTNYARLVNSLSTDAAYW